MVLVAAGSYILSVSITRSDVGAQIARRSAGAYRALSAEQQHHTVIIGESYIIAAYLDEYSDRYRLPEAYSLNRSYGYFPPPPAERDTVLYVGRDPGALLAYFAAWREVADIGDDMRAYLLTEQRRSWDAIWPQECTLMVF